MSGECGFDARARRCCLLPSLIVDSFRQPSLLRLTLYVFRSSQHLLSTNMSNRALATPQPQRKSARIKSAQSKAGTTSAQRTHVIAPCRNMSHSQSNAASQKVVSNTLRGRKKQAAREPSSRRRRRRIDDEVKELPIGGSRGSLSRLLEISLDILFEVKTLAPKRSSHY